MLLIEFSDELEAPVGSVRGAAGGLRLELPPPIWVPPIKEDIHADAVFHAQQCPGQCRPGIDPQACCVQAQPLSRMIEAEAKARGTMMINRAVSMNSMSRVRRAGQDRQAGKQP